LKQLLPLLILLASAGTSFGQSGHLGWAGKMGGGGDDYCTAITTDDSGNIYTTGFFEGVADFDPGPGTVNLTAAGSDDVYVMKQGPDGRLHWARRLGSNTRDRAEALRLEGGYLYVAGHCTGTVDFDPGPGSYVLGGNGVEDIFVLKLDAGGSFVWARRTTGGGVDAHTAITTDTAGAVYVGGSFADTVDFDPGPGLAMRAAAGTGTFDAFMLKLDAAGAFQWVACYGGSGDQTANAIAADKDGHIFLTGSFKGMTDFDPGQPTFLLTPLDADAFVLRMSSDGYLTWVNSVMGAGDAVGIALAVDGSGNVVSTGYFQGSADFMPGPGSDVLQSSPRGIFIWKLDNGGGYHWAKSVSGTGHNYGSALAVDTAGNIYTTGIFHGAADFDPSAAEFIMNSPAGFFTQTFVMKLNAGGRLRWAKGVFGQLYNGGLAIAVDKDDSVCVGGYFSGISNFGGTGSFTMIPAGYDAYVMKLGNRDSAGTGVKVQHVVASKDGFHIYPNPAVDKLTLSCNARLDGAQVLLMDVQGKTIQAWSGMAGNAATIDVSGISPGVYTMLVRRDSGTERCRLIIR
jgi:hypothetical protein